MLWDLRAANQRLFCPNFKLEYGVAQKTVHYCLALQLKYEIKSKIISSK